MKVVQEEDKFQHTLEKLNRLEMSSNLPPTTESYLSHGNYPKSQPQEVNYLGNRGGNLYSNTYNMSWKDHLNLKWEGNQRGNFNQNTQIPPYKPPHMAKSQEFE